MNAPDGVLLWASIVIPILFVLSVFPGIFAYTTLVERKALGRIQNRIGPNRVGRWGILQPIADGLKLLTKEDIVPRRADQFVHFLAPVIAVIPSILLFSVVPVGAGLVPVNLNIGILFASAVSTASVLALFMGGWASRNKFSLLSRSPHSPRTRATASYRSRQTSRLWRENNRPSACATQDPSGSASTA